MPEESLVGEKYPTTRTTLLTDGDVANWSFAQLRYAINEIYARHGYDFPRKEIKNIFLKYGWYRQILKAGSSTAEIESELSPNETANLKLLGDARDRLKLTEQSPQQNAAPNSDFVGEKYPMTRTEILTEEDVRRWSFAQLRYAINEMYARHGYDFPKEEVKNAFLRFQWYRNCLKPQSNSDEVEGEFSQTEKANLLLLGQRRDELVWSSSQPGNSTKTSEASSVLPSPVPSDAQRASTPPEIHAWIEVGYEYRSSAPPDKDGEQPVISSTERENLPRAKVIIRGNSVEQVVEGTATIVPLRISIALASTGKRDPGSLRITIVDADSGQPLSDFPQSVGEAIAELKKGGRRGTENTDFSLVLTDAQKAALSQMIRKWIERDEGEDRGEPSNYGIDLHVALGPVDDSG